MKIRKVNKPLLGTPSYLWGGGRGFVDRWVAVITAEIVAKISNAPRGSICSFKKLGTLKKGYLVAPHMGEIIRVDIEHEESSNLTNTGKSRFVITRLVEHIGPDIANRWNIDTINFVRPTRQNNNFLFSNYFYAHAYLQQWRKSVEG